MASCNHWKRRLRTFPVDFSSLVQIVLVLIGLTTRARGDVEINEKDIANVALHFGFELYETANFMTYMQEIKSEFERLGAWVKKKDGLKMVKEFSADIERMMAWKINAVARISENAEEAMQGHLYREELKFNYNNAKDLNTGPDGLILTRDKHFYNMPVNSSNSSIHVPTNVYNEDVSVLNAIMWSEMLNPTFQANYQLDPSLNWQYFGSSTGFLRQFPAWEWKLKPDTNSVDMYDCRMRPWYIEAATSPKDIVILIDSSGSMTGLRKEIAKHVAFNILDTLNDDDFFNIYKFNDTTKDLVPCFNSSLAQANMENIRRFKEELGHFAAEGVANFSNALTEAFETLHRFHRENMGSMCNQAIMLITDGAPQNFEELFSAYNANKTVRMFTYMIGQEMANKEEVEWIACNNRGYYSHVSTIAEARDQVQHYIPVMARPLVLEQRHNVIWTSVYADIVDPKTSDFLWEKGEKAMQCKKSITYEKYHQANEEPRNESETNMTNVEKFRLAVEEALPDRCDQSDPFQESPRDYYRLITTVAYPAFDRLNLTNETFGGFQYRSPPRFSKRDPLAPPAKKGKVAHLLGVAGTDVPIEEITKLAPPYKLGVNGYPFGITNNGYILFHPDLRYQYYHTETWKPGPPILKPDYNSVDLAEVELVDNDLLPRGNDSQLYKLRKRMIDGEVGHTRLKVKIHLDDMRRVESRFQEYYYAPLNRTPFSFGIAMPDIYGMHEVVGMIELKDSKLNSNLEYARKVTSLFEDRGNWTIHPDWVYCRYLYSNPERPELDKEDEFVHFLKSIHNRTVNLDSHRRVKNLPNSEDYSYAKAKKVNKNIFYCDKELVQSVVFDADALKIVARRGRSNKTRNFINGTNLFYRRSTANMMKITVVFVATRSGLTRWEEFEDSGRQFILNNRRAIDELWYRRAVDYHVIDNKSFVYSVQFDAGTRNISYVTASHAIFMNNKSHHGRAPVAVVGLRQKLHHFMLRFENATAKICGKDDLKCFLLDNNAFVVYSKDKCQIGKFYGEIDKNIMLALVEDKIFRRVGMVDYQAVCFERVASTDSSNLLLTPLNHLRSILAWTWSKILFFYLNFNLMNFARNVYANTNAYFEKQSLENQDSSCQKHVLIENIVPKPVDLLINKTRPKPCDKEYYLFHLNPSRFSEGSPGTPLPRKGKMFGCTNKNSTFSPGICNKSYLVHLVPHTNLVMLAVDEKCACETDSYGLYHSEIEYNETQTCTLLSSNIYRKRPEQCVSFHPQELQIKGHCSRGMLVVPSTPIVVLAVAVIRWLQHRFLSS